MEHRREYIGGGGHGGGHGGGRGGRRGHGGGHGGRRGHGGGHGGGWGRWRGHYGGYGGGYYGGDGGYYPYYGYYYDPYYIGEPSLTYPTPQCVDVGKYDTCDAARPVKIMVDTYGTGVFDSQKCCAKYM